MQEFTANMTRLKTELKRNVTELISGLPVALQQFSSVVDNEDQTATEMKKSLADLYAKNPQVSALRSLQLRSS